MTSCDLCGKPATTRARVEGVAVSVCASCATFGVSLAPPKPAGNVPRGTRPLHGLRESETEFVLAGDFGSRLRGARQKLKMTEEEAAVKLHIRKNDLLHFESGKRQPSEEMTRKLEKFYGVRLRLEF
jgi:uncharacterized protein (TIGR00270 family)